MSPESVHEFSARHRRLAAESKPDRITSLLGDLAADLDYYNSPEVKEERRGKQPG